jgi:hypothetical protein
VGIDSDDRESPAGNIVWEEVRTERRMGVSQLTGGREVGRKGGREIGVSTNGPPFLPSSCEISILE